MSIRVKTKPKKGTKQISFNLDNPLYDALFVRAKSLGFTSVQDFLRVIAQKAVNDI